MLKNFIRRVALTMVFTLTMGLGITSAALAATGAPAPAPTGCKTGAAAEGTSKNQVLGGIDETTTDCSEQSGQNAISATISILSWVIGVVAVLVIIGAGFKYITSGGDSSAVSSAKSTLVYAAIGLVVAALAQFMIHFVINQAAPACTPVTGGETCNDILKCTTAGYVLDDRGTVPHCQKKD